METLFIYLLRGSHIDVSWWVFWKHLKHIWNCKPVLFWSVCLCECTSFTLTGRLNMRLTDRSIDKLQEREERNGSPRKKKGKLTWPQFWGNIRCLFSFKKQTDTHVHKWTLKVSKMFSRGCVYFCLESIWASVCVYASECSFVCIWHPSEPQLAEKTVNAV